MDLLTMYILDLMRTNQLGHHQKLWDLPSLGSPAIFMSIFEELQLPRFHR